MCACVCVWLRRAMADKDVMTQNKARTVLYCWWKRIWCFAPIHHSKHWSGHKTYRWPLIPSRLNHSPAQSCKKGTLYVLGGHQTWDVFVVHWPMPFLPDTPHNPQKISVSMRSVCLTITNYLLWELSGRNILFVFLHENQLNFKERLLNLL